MARALGRESIGVCTEKRCEEGAYADGLCKMHYSEWRSSRILLTMIDTVPKKPEDLPVRPLRVEWVGRKWAVYMPLPLAHEGQPCREHPEDFFAEEWDKGGKSAAKVERAKASCIRCPDRVGCMEYGIAHAKDHGIWGGTTPEERRRVLAARGQVAVELHAAWLATPAQQEAS